MIVLTFFANFTATKDEKYFSAWYLGHFMTHESQGKYHKGFQNKQTQKQTKQTLMLQIKFIQTVLKLTRPKELHLFL